MKLQSTIQPAGACGGIGNSRGGGAHAVRFALLAFLVLSLSALTAKAQQIVCDGQTDTTAAINNALANMSPGGTLILPAGVCIVSSSINGFVSGNSMSNPTTLHGSGILQTTIQAIDTGSNVFPFDVIEAGQTLSNNPTVTAGVQYVRIANMIVDGEVPTPTTVTCDTQGDNGGSGVLVLTSDSINVSQLTIQNVVGGVTLMGSTNTSVGANTINGAQANGVYVVGKNGCEKGGAAVAALGNLIEGNTIENVSQAVPAGSGYTTGQHGWDGIDTEAGASNTTIESNVIDGDDILVRCSSTTYCYGNVVKTNTINNSLNTGIDVEGEQEDFTVAGNTISTTNWGGIDVNGPVTILNSNNNVINNNTLTGIDQGDPPDYPGNGNPGIPYFGGEFCGGIGIKATGQVVAGQPQHVVVSNNHVSTTYTTMPTYPVACVYGPVNSSVQIINNTFPNRTGDGNSEVYVDPRSSAVVSGNTDGN